VNVSEPKRRGGRKGALQSRDAAARRPYLRKTIDEYLAGVKPDQRRALEKLRQTIRTTAPQAAECISYGIPAFRLNGRSLVFFGAWANHCSFYPGSSTF